MGLKSDDPEGVYNAVDIIAEFRQAKNLDELPVGRRIVVIGGGNTAIDISVQSKKFGAKMFPLFTDAVLST
ncbi:MAG: hypothetical protein CM1200mP30_21100 [Pseudomonadota bacterium]|nr:MAG: hypothetical protein CM1200mP30_21100 [Pseudomonadota bacterium]